jgi:DNA-directed RNA polymerase subunit M/transcription elongation factor TFIIS
MAGKLQKCPKCSKVLVYWDSKGINGEGCWECLACGKVYVTENDLIVAECNVRNEEKFKDSQRNSA